MKNVKLVGFSIIVILLGTIIVMVFENKGGGVNLFKKMVNTDKNMPEVSLNPKAVSGELSEASGEAKPLPTSKLALDVKDANFEKTGNLVAEELVYEEPGKPAIRVGLVFNGTSWCENKPCLMGANPSIKGKYADGTRVKIIGKKEDDKVTVYVLKLVE